MLSWLRRIIVDLGSYAITLARHPCIIVGLAIVVTTDRGDAIINLLLHPKNEWKYHKNKHPTSIVHSRVLVIDPSPMLHNNVGLAMWPLILEISEN